MTAASHHLALRVYYEDTDAGGVVYHANYLKFAERARTEFLRLRGLDHPSLLAAQGGHFVVTGCTVAYRAPARLDDLLEVETSVLRVTRARLALQQTVRREGKVLTELEVWLAFVGRDLRPMRLPPGIAA